MNRTHIDKANVAKRTVILPNLQDDQDDAVIHEFLDGMEGLVEASINPKKKTVRILYDASQLDYDKVAEQLDLAGYPVSEGRWMRLKAAMYRFEDENIHNNAKKSEGACCSHPQGIYTSKRR